MERDTAQHNNRELALSALTQQKKPKVFDKRNKAGTVASLLQHIDVLGLHPPNLTSLKAYDKN